MQWVETVALQRRHLPARKAAVNMSENSIQDLLREIGLAIEQRHGRSTASTATSTKELTEFDSVIRHSRLNVPIDPAKTAQTFLSKKYSRIHRAICRSKRRREKLLVSDEATFVAAVVDILPGLTLGVPIVTLATLLARIGIKRLCDGNPFEDLESDFATGTSSLPSAKTKN